MFELTKITLLKLTFAAIFISGLTTFAAAQTDHINLEEGLPTQLEDAYPTAYRNREVQFFTRYERTRDGRDRVTFQPTLEFGIFRNTELKFTAPFYTGSGDVSKTLVWAGILLILATGAIHLVETPHHFEEAKYVGVLFVLNGIGAAVATVGIYLQRGWGWWLGALIAAFSIISYIISRTVGLPGTEIEDWDIVGVISLVVEAAFLLVFLPAFSSLRKGTSLTDK